MAIEVECEHCHAKMTVQPHHVGQKIGCPRCKRQLLVSKPAEPDVAPIVPIITAKTKSGGFFSIPGYIVESFVALIWLVILAGVWFFSSMSTGSILHQTVRVEPSAAAIVTNLLLVFVVMNLYRINATLKKNRKGN